MPGAERSSERPFYLAPLSRYGIAGFTQGAGLPLRAVGFLLERPKLWLLVAIPLAFNITMFTIILVWGIGTVPDFVHGMLSDSSAALAAREGFLWSLLGYLVAGARWLATLFLWLLVLVVVYYLFIPLSLLIAAPFNDRIAETAERACGFDIVDDRPLVKMVLSEALYAVVCEAKRLALIVSVFIFLLPLNFLPVVGNVVYFVLSFTWACWCGALEFTGYAADRRHMGLRRKLAILRANLAPCMGFGLATVMLMMIPFLNVLMVPVGAVGGTLLFGMIRKSGRIKT